ncbi:MAG TPA: glycosyltransferase family 39 protein [Gemmatales bacterium]|nr:glycosyltransferase family 39 protein [Gemmatales bacterium]HMP59918.1 glycosyltransferase family 39 protein [Gemmatales bacterium]
MAWVVLALVILGLTGVRLAYLATPFSLELSQDEAHYWDWSRHLDWSYYSKGPVVAWLIRLSCVGAGGDTMLAVRTPAVLCSAFTLLGLAVLTRQVTGRPWLGVLVATLVGTYPVFAAGALLMTIDAPYLCAWTWALVVAVHLLFHPEPKSAHWITLGLLVGIGILAKYTMVLFLPGLGLFMLVARDQRRRLRQAGPWLMLGTVALCGLPILIWNMQHDWVTVRHVGGQAGLNTSEFGQTGGWNVLGPLEYLGGQAGLLLGFWFVIFLAALGTSLGKGLTELRQGTPASFLALMATTVFGVFLAFSLKTKVQLNWPVAAYLAAIPLMADWLAVRLDGSARGRAWFLGATVTSVIGLGLTVALHASTALYPMMHGWFPDWPVRRWDPTCRLRGWQSLASHVQVLRLSLRADGKEPVLAATAWNLPGVVAFYLPDQPVVFSLGPAAGQRQSQYEFWPPQPPADPGPFLGQTFIIVGPVSPQFQAAFEQVEHLPPVTVRVDGHDVATHFLTVARGFRGF